MPGDKLNIIIPFYNPHPGWENNFIDCMIELKEELNKTLFEVILVNDGSTLPLNRVDEIISRFDNLRYYSYPHNLGKGYAIRYGISRSDADFYIYTDIDFPFGCKIILQTYNLLKSSGADIVIGTRDNSYLRMLPVKRRIISYLLQKFNYLITGFKIKDTQAGLKGLNNTAKKILTDTKVNTFIFELEFLKNSLKKGLTYEIINVRSRPEMRFTDFRFRVIFKEIISILKLII